MAISPLSAFALRPLRAGDEIQLAALFNLSVTRACGPLAVTPESWLEQYRERSWRGPGLEDDPDCIRVAERDAQIVGYCVTDYRDGEVALVQELCVVEEPEAEAIAQALLEDAEARGRERGQPAIVLLLPQEDGFIAGLVGKLGYESAPTGGVFMTLITDLAGVFRDLQPELTRRLSASKFSDWSGTLSLRSGGMEAALRVRRGRVEVSESSRADFAADLSPEVLPLVIFGQADVGEAYLQNNLQLRTGDTRRGLELLDTLFPRLPMYLPRAQSW